MDLEVVMVTNLRQVTITTAENRRIQFRINLNAGNNKITNASRLAGQSLPTAKSSSKHSFNSPVNELPVCRPSAAASAKGSAGEGEKSCPI